MRISSASLTRCVPLIVFGGGAIMEKQCPKCHKSWPSYFLICCDCGYEFPVRKSMSSRPGSLGCVAPLGLLLAWSGLLFYVYQQIEPCPPCIEDCFCLGRRLFQPCCGLPTYCVWLFVATEWWHRSGGAFFPKHTDGSTNWRVLGWLSAVIIWVTLTLLSSGGFFGSFLQSSHPFTAF
jgi:hypothetical protein